MPKADKKVVAKKVPAEAKVTAQSFAHMIEASIQQTQQMKLVAGIEVLAEATSVTQLVDQLIQKAWGAGASDIHIDPQAESVIIRYRIDGVLHDVASLKKELQPLIITRIKVLAGLRTDEHLMAQDGRFHLTAGSTDVELRISILPTFHGENVVIRLLAGGVYVLALESLGFSKHDLAILQRYIRKTYGMILATGPTGSGKTTTLYSIMRVLNVRDASLVTIEDPIEYAVEGVTQLQVNAQTGFTFATGLRSIVRQDPNMIMVGEIRDEETAGIAVNAAMTGHLLLSTLHTIDAATTLPRLLDMGIEPFLIASTVNVIIGQRLVRKLCERCREQYALSPEERAALVKIIPEALLKQYEKQPFWRAVGCDQCSHSGYLKRVGIYEVLEVDESIQPLIMRRANAEEIREAARKGGMVTMFEDGFLKATAGVTSLAELIRVVND